MNNDQLGVTGDLSHPIRWRIPCTKKNGSLRTTFTSWHIPTKISEAHQLVDGGQYHIAVRLAKFYYYEGDVKLTSGRDIPLPKSEATKLELLANRQPSLSVAFSLSFGHLEPSLESFEIDLQNRIREARKLSAADRQTLLAKSPKQPQRVEVTTTIFLRNAYVIAEVLARANGVCEGCKSKAPFVRASDKTPYLEVHHKTRLADHGKDTVQNAIALCPNCHRKAHYG